MSNQIINQSQLASPDRRQDDQPASFEQLNDCELESRGASGESSVLASLHRWGPSMALLAAGFLSTPPDLLGPLVGSGMHH
jgi:hypothetical protein